MVIENIIITILVLALVIIVSSLPLYLSVGLMGGRTTILKTFLVMVVAAVVFSVVAAIAPFGTIIASILLIWIDRKSVV